MKRGRKQKVIFEINSKIKLNHDLIFLDSLFKAGTIGQITNRFLYDDIYKIKILDNKLNEYEISIKRESISLINE